MGGSRRAVALFLAAFCLFPQQARAQPAPAPTEAVTREKALAGWAETHKPEIVQALAEAGDAEVLARIRTSAAPLLGAISDDEMGTLLLAGADEQLAAGAAAEGRRLGQITLDLAVARKLGPGLEFDALTRTGSAAFFQEDYKAAARDLGLAAEKAAQITPYDANSVANAGANYAVVLDQAGRYREAEAAFTRSIAIRATAARFEAAGVAVAHSSRAAVRLRMGRSDLAEADYRKALDIMEGAGVQNSRAYVRVLHNYAVMLAKAGRDGEAAPLYRRALALMEPELRHAANAIPDHSALAASLIGIGDLDGAEAALRDAIAIAEAQPKAGTDAAAAYANRAMLRDARGDLAGAEADARRVVAIDREMRGGDENIEVPGDLVRLSRLLVKRGAAADAARISAEAVAGLGGIPEDNPLHAVILDGRAEALAADRQLDQALLSSRAAAENWARVHRSEGGREAGPIPSEERPILGRRIELLWRIAERRRP